MILHHAVHHASAGRGEVEGGIADSNQDGSLLVVGFLLPHAWPYSAKIVDSNCVVVRSTYVLGCDPNDRGRRIPH
jgi:hypothetical protein